MSILIKGMEMPENCECCPMVYTADVQGYHWCAALEQEVEQGLSRPKECPIICQLPEGHGRLIDASTIIGEVDAGYTDDYGNPIPVNRPVSVDEYLGLEVPTIVPAEAQRKFNASDAVAPTDTPTDTPTVPAERSDT